MTEQDLEIQELRRELSALRSQLKRALKDLDYCLVQFEMCQICAYADADCDPDAGQCVPKWRGLV